MQIIERFRPWLGKKSVKIAITIIILIIAVGLYGNTSDNSIDKTETTKTVVRVTTPTEYIGGQTLSLIGNVRAFSEAEITSERAGQVVSVNVVLGQQVSAGTILATLENASERAAVLQAEGVYDAAIAASAQSGVGVDEANNSLKSAQNAAISTLKSSYNTTNGVIVNSIDSFFANPNDSVPGLRLDGRSFTADLNNKRVALQTILPAWQARISSLSVQSDLNSELEYASQNIQSVINMIDIFLIIFNQYENSNRYTDAELLTFSNTFTNLRSTLIATQSNIDGVETGLASAVDNLRKAELSALGGKTSVSDAQVKQALGSLRAAQAQLAKTILRTPISGTVNSLSLRTGDFINSFDKVAVIANNNALEIVTYISDAEKELIHENDTVLIEGKFEGIITQISPAVDSLTRKTEVRIATEGIDIVNGDTVKITKDVGFEEITTENIQVPLTAIKFDRENGFIFVIEEGKLVSKTVLLGSINGNSIQILDGLTINETFVLDARGLTEGEEVEF